jgi:hypothetical protein
MVLMRVVAALAAVAGIGLAGVACSSGLSTSDAQSRCTAEQAGKMYCWNDAVTANCVDCYQRCGNSCTGQGTCPSTYLCPGDPMIDAGGDGN